MRSAMQYELYIAYMAMAMAMAALANPTPSPIHAFFRKVPGGLTQTGPGIPFDPSWLNPKINATDTDTDTDTDIDVTDTNFPAHLPVPENVQVLEFEDNNNINNNIHPTLQDLGKAAREIVNSCWKESKESNSNTAQCTAVLFRNLHSRIQTAEDFSIFWKQGCLNNVVDDADVDVVVDSSKKSSWTPAKYIPFGPQRSQLKGVDLVTNFPPSIVLSCHNEMAYNPQEAGRIAFYCLENAPIGGETILVTNNDLTQCVSTELQDLVKAHGGILYQRKYHDHESNKHFSLSWQTKCGTQDRAEAIAFFTDIGFEVDNNNDDNNNNNNKNRIYFDDDGTLIVQNVHSGFLLADARPTANNGNNNGNNEGEELQSQQQEHEQQVWFNILNTGWFSLADGTKVPPHLLAALIRDEWRPVQALKLQPGDWLVLNNRLVQHGRLPYQNTPEQQRTILTVYTE